MSASHESQGNERQDPVARLLRLAGELPQLDAARRARLDAAVRPEWRRAVKARRARRWMVLTGALAAAAALLAAILGSDLRRGRSGRAAPLGAELSVLGVIGGEAATLLGREGGESPLLAGSSLGQGQTIVTGESRVALRLSERASLRLDRATRVRFDSPGEVALELGALYVDTGGEGSQSARGSLSVKTPLGTVEHVGTQFEVRLLADRLRVRVREGSVVVRSEHGSFVGRAGEELVLLGDATLERIAVGPTDSGWEWVVETALTPQLDGRALRHYLDWVERESGRRVRFARPELESIAEARLHGDVGGIGLRESLEVLLPINGLAARWQASEIVLSAAAPAVEDAR